MTASGSDRVARTAIISAKAATILNSRQPGVKAGEPAGEPATSRTSARRGAKADEPATSRTSARQDVQVVPTSSARPENRADLLEVLQRVDAEVKTTLPSSLRRPISRFSSVRDRVEKANGMTVIQAIELNIYTLRTLRSDESAEYIALVRTSDRIRDLSVRDTDGDDLRKAGICMDGDDDAFMSHPTDDFSD